MAAGIGIAMLLYVTGITVCLFAAYRQIRRLGTEDRNTGLLNRNAYYKYKQDREKEVFASVTRVFADLNGLHTINNERGHSEGDRFIQTVSHALNQQFDGGSLFRIGGDEFVAFSESADAAECEEKMTLVSAMIEAADPEFLISYGIVNEKGNTGLDGVIRQADEKMLENKRNYYSRHNRRDRSFASDNNP